MAYKMVVGPLLDMIPGEGTVERLVNKLNPGDLIGGVLTDQAIDGFFLERSRILTRRKQVLQTTLHTLEQPM
jgi:hypothetical protein